MDLPHPHPPPTHSPPTATSHSNTNRSTCSLDSSHKASTAGMKSVGSSVSMALPRGLVTSPDGSARTASHVPQCKRIVLISASCSATFLAVNVFFAYLLFDFRVNVSTAEYLPGRVHAVTIFPTILLLPATFSIVTAFVTIGPILYLSSFLHARRLLSQVDAGRVSLLTRTEAGLFVEPLAGGFLPWLRALKDCFSRRRRTNNLIKCATTISTVLFLNCLILIAMNIAIHISSKIVDVDAPTTTSHQANMWGRALITECAENSSSQNGSLFQTNLGSQDCPVHLGVFSGEKEAEQTAKKLSATNRVVTLDGVALIVDARATDNASFIASTLGSTTSCAPVGQNCQLDGDELTFLCPTFGFSGTFTKPFVLAPTNDSSVSERAVAFLVAANLTGSDGAFQDLIMDYGAIVSRRTGSLLTVFECASQFSRWQYARTPGLTRALKSKDLDLSLVELLLSPMVPGMIQGYSGFGLDFLTDGMAKVSKGTNSLAQLADSFADVFNQVAMAPVASMAREIPVDSDLASYRLTIVSLPLAMVVIGLNTFMAILALVLGVLAYRACSKAGVLYYQWEFSMVEMTRQFFNPIVGTASPIAAQGHQEPNYAAEASGPADYVSLA